MFLCGNIGTGLKTFSNFISSQENIHVFDVKKICVEKKLNFIKQKVEFEKFKKGFDPEEYENQMNKENSE